MATAAPARTQAPSAEEKLYRVALREALTEEMERDDSVYLIGEDIGKFGGAYRVTEGLLDTFGPHRVVGAPAVAPTTPEDAKGMLKSAIRADNPVMFLESMSLYNVRGMVPPGDYTVPLGKAAVRRSGSDVTIVGVSRMAVLANEAAKQLEEE